MVSGDNRCSQQLLLASSAKATNLCRNTAAAAIEAHSIRAGRCDMKISIANEQQQQVTDDKLTTSELLKLTNLKLHDDDNCEISETTTSTRLQLLSNKNNIEAPAQLAQKQQQQLPAKVERRMLLAAEQSPAASNTNTNDESAGQQQLQRMQQQQQQQPLVDPSNDYANEYSAQDPTLSSFGGNGTTGSGRNYYESQHHHQTANHFGPTYSLELDSSSYLAGNSAGSYGGADFGHHQQSGMDFLELEPSDSRHLHSGGQQGNKIYHQQQQQLSNNFDTQHYDATGSTQYLSLDPSPAAYDCDLPDSVIRLNYQQQQLGSSHIQTGSGQQFNPQEPPVSTIQFGGHQYYTSESHQHLQQQQQQQDSGHVSSLSNVDSTASLVLGGLDGSSCQPLQVSGSQLIEQHHPQQQQQQMMMIHQQQQEQEPELKVCEWEGCENTFLDMLEFVKHLEDRHVNQEPKEKNRYFCLWANCKRNEQEFNARYKLLIHMRVHSGEKPYPCSSVNCRKSFSRLENLKIHQRSHTGEKPYKCIFDGCSKSFTNSSDRIKHHKTHKDPKPYSCNYSGCSKRYTDPSSLRKHLRAHKRAQLPSTLTYGGGSGEPASTSGAGGSCYSGSNYEPSSSSSVLRSSSFEPHLGYHQSFSNVNTQRELPSVANRLVADQQQQQSLRHNSSFNYDNHHNQQQQPHNNNNNHNLQLASQQQQLSRSWCAGTTRPPQELAPPPLLDWPANGQPSVSYRPLQHNYLPHQQPTQQQQQQQPVEHEALMRSLPLGGFRVPYSRLWHAHAEWPPPPLASQPAAGGHSNISADIAVQSQQQQANFP